ncbi:uncharacterized protein LOC112562441 isoform X2 [Pomacea canaliculata]|uniref:uncharacterized protein LOC112562441 isoform X2 n=1 Tax=Pomacea canaliculata TaxID=400727 RepID=UPI000D7272A9|nr:uncharacterized protein LOC112562441 isoform X2 [Pomacea canaliculata]
MTIFSCLLDDYKNAGEVFFFQENWLKEEKYKDWLIKDSINTLLFQKTLYKRAAVIEEFWDLINTAHVENGHIGLSQTYAAIRRVYALLPRCLVAKYIQLCPICRRTARQSYIGRNRAPPAVLPSTKLVDGGSINRSELNQTITVVTTTSPTQFDALGTTEIIADGTLQASAIQSIIAQEGLSNSDVIAEITLNQTEDGQTVAVVSEAPSQVHLDGHHSAHSEMETQTHVVTMEGDGTAVTASPQGNPVVIFNCHICNKQFEKKLTYQRHLRTHSEHNPTMPVVLTPPPPKRIKLERRTRSVGQRHAVILDVDMGVDAGQALMLAACRPDVDVMAVTCVSGIVTIEHACNNALRVLKACNREDIPVFRGAEKPLVGEATQTTENLVGVAWDSSVDTRQIEPEHAVSALIRFVNDNPGQITLVCLGPLTNLALALRLDPQVGKKLKNVYILGGNIEGRGSSTPCAEQNFHFDPESAHIVLQETSNITLLPYEVCSRHVLAGDFFYSWVHLGTVKSEFVRTSSDENWLQLHNKNGYAPGCAYAMAVAIDRSIATDQELVFARVELGGTLARGMMVVDWGLVWGKANIQIVRSLDMGKIQGMLAAMVQDEAILEQY